MGIEIIGFVASSKDGSPFTHTIAYNKAQPVNEQFYKVAMYITDDTEPLQCKFPEDFVRKFEKIDSPAPNSKYITRDRGSVSQSFRAPNLE